MGEAARYASGTFGATVGVAMIVVGAFLLLTGPVFHAQSGGWWTPLYGSESSEVVVVAAGVLGMLFVVMGGYLLAVALRGLR